MRWPDHEFGLQSNQYFRRLYQRFYLPLQVLRKLNKYSLRQHHTEGCSDYFFVVLLLLSGLSYNPEAR
jgi:hypothetical protein